MKRILICLLFFFIGCTPSTPKVHFCLIGRDTNWVPLNFDRKTIHINGFTNALIQELNLLEKTNFQIIDVSWDQLLQGLEKKNYTAVLTSLDPNAISKEIYTFSDPFLLTGPVLVTPIDGDIHSLADLENTTVGAYAYDNSVLILQNYPSILIETYQSILNALQAVKEGRLAGALIPHLEAQSFLGTIYDQTLRISTPPLSDQGLRLITLKNQHPNLIKNFNHGLKKLQKNGNYCTLQRRFRLTGK
ncbi:MAG: transporter substrate-binding domain-containing protein [Chlamydiales bacterium]